jgi:aminopeptidase N
VANSKFGRDNLRKLLKNPVMRVSLERIVTDLNEAEQFQLNRLLKELRKANSLISIDNFRN